MAAFTTDEILERLDRGARDATFPMLDNGYIAPGTVRLTAFRDEERWSIAIEVVGAFDRIGGAESLCDRIYVFGNCVNRPPGRKTWDGRRHRRREANTPEAAVQDTLYPAEEDEHAPVFLEEDDRYARPDARHLRVRGETVPLELSEEALARKGVAALREPDRVHCAELLRSLLPEYRHLFLATDEELRRHVPDDLPVLLRLDEWHHPDLARGELPGQSEAFRMIADALVTGDPARYAPTLPPNTRWSHWPEGGAL